MPNPLQILRNAVAHAQLPDHETQLRLAPHIAHEIAALLYREQTVLDFSREGGVVCCLHETAEDNDQVTDLAFDALGVTLHLLSLRLNLRTIRIGSRHWRSIDGALRGFCEEEG